MKPLSLSLMKSEIYLVNNMSIFEEMTMEEFNKRLEDESFRQSALELINLTCKFAKTKNEANNAWNMFANKIIGARFMESRKK